MVEEKQRYQQTLRVEKKKFEEEINQQQEHESNKRERVKEKRYSEMGAKLDMQFQQMCEENARNRKFVAESRRARRQEEEEHRRRVDSVERLTKQKEMERFREKRDKSSRNIGQPSFQALNEEASM